MERYVMGSVWSRQMRFGMICEAHDIEHRLTKPDHPRTNGQVERMNPTTAMTSCGCTSPTSWPPITSPALLKTLSGLTPYEYIAKIGTSEPDRILNPIHQMPGLNT